jgi:hypothetical protein
MQEWGQWHLEPGWITWRNECTDHSSINFNRCGSCFHSFFDFLHRKAVHLSRLGQLPRSTRSLYPDFLVSPFVAFILTTIAL